MVETAEKTIDQGLNVRIKRTSQRMTQTDLADLMNISPQKLSDIEKKPVIDDKTLNLIAEKLDTDVNWFKTYDPNGMERYNSATINTNTEGAQSNNGSTVINNPIKEVMELTQMAVAKLEERYKKEIELKEQNFALQLENALLKQRLELMGKNQSAPD